MKNRFPDHIGRPTVDAGLTSFVPKGLPECVLRNRQFHSIPVGT